MKTIFNKSFPATILKALLILGAITTMALYSGCNSQGPVVETLYGPVRSYGDIADTWVWKAIPFAKPPVGDLRWKAPQDPDVWEEVREEQQFCPPCSQTLMINVGSEDCLYLNIWRPQTQEKDLPVYFWIHGGGNSLGAAMLPDYNGANLASKANMVVVTTSYRLGPMGWLTYRALRSGEPDADRDTKMDDSGNYGTLDLIKGLSWMKDNIAAFGGNPNNVTIAGESAGGINVLSLLISPPATGLFHRAVSQSGYTTTSTVEEGDASARAMILNLLIKDRTAADELEAETILNNMSNEAVESYLRSKTAHQIIGAYETSLMGMLSLPYLFQDGTVIPSNGFDALGAGTYPNKVPIIIGSNKEETKLFLFPDPYFKDKDELYQIVADYSSDGFKVNGVDAVARQLNLNDNQPNVYAYQFLWGAGGDTGQSVIPDPWGFLIGSSHTLEIPFFFGNDVINVAMQLLVFNEENRPGREALSAAMMTYLAQFARTGDPNQPGAELPEWQPWSNEERGPKVIHFDVHANQALDIQMSTEELTEAIIEERLINEVPESLYLEVVNYLESMGW